MYAACVHNEVIMNQNYLFDLLGGVRPGAVILDVPPTTASSWKKRGIPDKRVPEIIDKLRENGFDIDFEKLGIRWLSAS